MNAELLMWQALTPVHSGTGQSSAGVIDLPIAREGATGFPMLPGSSIKGVLRAWEDPSEQDPAERERRKDALFGYADKRIQDASGKETRESRAGRLTFTDARLLCLPVRSYRGTFAYVTCPLVLSRLRRDLAALGHPLALPEVPEVKENTAQVAGDTLMHGGQVLLEDLDLQAEETASARAWAEALAELSGLGDELRERFALLSDDEFGFLAETATEVTAHIRLDAETKTVAGGALWYEEALPAASLLTSFLLRPQDVTFAPPSSLQLGGKGSVGRGLLSVRAVGR
ncbi:type III-B CRISPR module RAMP protein Cmr4 [Deinococcus sp. S9]|uniref:type III-B CRISPR module RAMP protein Cmr4 n=1 Tax=Deinococcus sp. S9 TaxID=2545754 RepID=UPI0010549D68|nr:type III-B CRISPR module RAMP protein Cmr4 [Deinococcus sp. S9]TDE86738.1 type III-B CRISPR module RAMP protein Cmr4 [Deinococcus sp. S9]